MDLTEAMLPVLTASVSPRMAIVLCRSDVIILSYLDEHPALDSEILETIRKLGRAYRTDNLKQLEACVTPALQEEARAMLNEWWGIID